MVREWNDCRSQKIQGKLISYNLKSVVGQFNESFQGNDQQDSQEFLAFLLDALHEDLNLSRIKGAKPIKVEEEEDDGMPDEV